MKIVVMLKDPDSLSDAIADAVKAQVESLPLSSEERELITETRTLGVTQRIVDRWVEYGEYYRIEFDTDAGTARVLPRDEKEGWNG